jgi:hypothetical protein
LITSSMNSIYEKSTLEFLIHCIIFVLVNFMSTWLVYGIPVFGQTTVLMLLWKYFAEVINIQISRLWVKQISFQLTGCPHAMS